MAGNQLSLEENMILQLNLSSIFEAIPFHSIFINNVFLVIRNVSKFFETTCIFIIKNNASTAIKNNA